MGAMTGSGMVEFKEGTGEASPSPGWGFKKKEGGG